MRRLLATLAVVLMALVYIGRTVWPQYINGYLDLFDQYISVNVGAVVTMVVVLSVLLLSQQVRLWLSKRDKKRVRRGLGL
jgi:hypothetical protein